MLSMRDIIMGTTEKGEDIVAYKESAAQRDGVNAGDKMHNGVVKIVKDEEFKKLVPEGIDADVVMAPYSWKNPFSVQHEQNGEKDIPFKKDSLSDVLKTINRRLPDLPAGLMNEGQSNFDRDFDG